MVPTPDSGPAAAAEVADLATDTPAGSGRGRPRAAGRTDAILDATIELFEEVGYDHLRIQDVADRAGAGLATIYRRWPTKQALVADAIRRKGMLIDSPVTGDPVADLTCILRTFGEHACGHGADFMPGFIAAVRAEPDIADAFRNHLLRDLRGQIRARLVPLLGEDNPRLELLTDLVPAVVLFRTTLSGEEVDAEALANQVVELVLTCDRAGASDASTIGSSPV
jgi:AcrR family transcriptional regulator